MGHLHPPLDFPLHGLDRSWTGPRWLEFVDGRAEAPVWGAWLAHGHTRKPPPTEPFVIVGMLSLERWLEHGARYGTDPARSLAWAAMFALVGQTTPSLGEVDQKRYWTGALALVDAWADELSRWERLMWTVDGDAVIAPVSTWAGAWAGFIDVLPAVGVVVVGWGIDPDHLVLNRVNDSAAYHFNADAPLRFPGTLVASSSVALGASAASQWSPWPLHDDQRRILAEG